MTAEIVYSITPVSLSTELEYCRSLSVEPHMDFHGQKVQLSFSIENILRDDFPHPRRTNVVNLPTRESSFERWPTAPVYKCYAVRYSPVFMKYLPNINRLGGRVHRVNGDKEQLLPKHPENNNKEDRLRCKEETISKSDEGKKVSFL